MFKEIIEENKFLNENKKLNEIRKVMPGMKEEFNKDRTMEEKPI